MNPEDLTADDTVVWFFPASVINSGLLALMLARLQKNIIGQEACEELHHRLRDRFCHFYIGEMLDKDPDSKERLVLAVGGKYSVGHLKNSFPADRMTRVMADHGKRFPYNHRLALFLNYQGATMSNRLNPLPWYLENVADATTVVLARIEFELWFPERRAWFNTQFGDAVRAGADCIEVGGVKALDVIKYVLNRSKFRVEEEMISWKPLVSTKVGERYKEQLDTIAPRPFESWRKMHRVRHRVSENINPEELTSDDTVVWFFPFLVGTEGLVDLIGQEACEELLLDYSRRERFCHFYVGEMPERDPDSKERLVLAVGGQYHVGHLKYSAPADRITRAMADHGKRFPYNHRLALFLHRAGRTLSNQVNPVPWYLENVADASTMVFVRMGLERWLPDRRAWFNTQFGDAVRAGADCIDVGDPGQISLKAMDVIKYTLNKNKFRVEEEMISWKPLASTKAGEVYKEQLATLTPKPLESWRNDACTNERKKEENSRVIVHINYDTSYGLLYGSKKLLGPWYMLASGPLEKRCEAEVRGDTYQEARLRIDTLRRAILEEWCVVSVAYHSMDESGFGFLVNKRQGGFDLLYITT
ncbi:hypothetical protein FA15DRAFT_715357 [Coprinopsis marcescibilis]|uniref:Uncharacterized protein n=1 Tax=Coprinopsis marcescibilis TaxID=230819 RepID=A0A5C3L8I6_COPMA|nr:hypothetical protein FA15DRAFT_715357 [Coprinopsis marcescibilis]